MTIKYLLQKEFTQIRRNAFLPRLIIVFPIMIMCVMPWVMNMEVKNIKVEIVDNDRSVESQRLIHKVEASNYFIFNGQQLTYDLALKDIEGYKTDIAVVIPAGFGENMETGKFPEILIAANTVNGMKGSMGAAYISQIFTMNENRGANIGGGIKILNLFNKNLNYKLFMIPALLAIVIMLMCGFLPTLNIVGEKEAGTIEQINVTPVGKMTFIFAKLIPYWIIAAFILTVALLISWVLYGITCQGNLVLVYLLAMLLAVFFSAFGLIISNYSDNLQQAVMVMWFFVVIMMLMSGLFTPTRSMPDWAYTTTYVNPMHYFIDAIRTVFIRGGDIKSILHQIGALSLISAIMTSWAIISYKKNS